jgi:hypothetical protein
MYQQNMSNLECKTNDNNDNNKNNQLTTMGKNNNNNGKNNSCVNKIVLLVFVTEE